MAPRTIGTNRLIDGAKIDNLPANTITELSNKVDKVSGKGLSTNDYDNTEKAAVASAVQNISAGTNITVTRVGNDVTINSTGGSGIGDVNGPAANTDSYIPQWDGTDSKTLKNGIPTSTFAPALTSDENYVTDAEKIVIGNTSNTNSGDNATNSQYSGLATSKQDTLVSGTNIKTINGRTILGAGDIEIQAGGGGGFTPVYLTNLTSTTNPAYKQSSYTPDISETIVNTITNNNEVLARTYIYDGDVGLTTINAGTWAFDIYAYVSSAVGNTKIRLETFKRTAGGIETTLFSVSSNEINNLTTALINFATTQGVFACNATDRLGTRVYVNTTANINITASYVVGDGNASFFTTPLQLRASQVRNTPAGNILSTDVQGAINELDSEKAPLSSPTFTGIVTTPAIKITGGTPGLGKVLTSDADGDATWETASSGGSNPIYQTFIAGEQVVGQVTRFTAKGIQTIAGVKISLATLPTGADFKVDVRKNGILSTNSIFTSDAGITITTSTGATNGIYTVTNTTIDNGILAENDILYFYVTQVGSTLSGTNLEIVAY